MFILHQNRDSPGNKFQFSSKSRCFFGGICAKNPRQLARRGCGDLRNLGGRSLHKTNDLGAQLVERRKDRKSGVKGKSVSVRVAPGGRRIVKKKTIKNKK